jgi:aspartate ammonia-lyase
MFYRSRDEFQDGTMNVRMEHDLLGDREVPTGAYYGIHTLRAVENFPITGVPISTYPDLVDALAGVKAAAAKANCRLGLLDATRATAIVAAATRSAPAPCTTSSWST